MRLAPFGREGYNPLGRATTPATSVPAFLKMPVACSRCGGVVDLARRLQPDVVLLDPVMPQTDGVQATPRIVESSLHSRVIILTSFSEEDKGFPAIRAGAQGYLLKDIAPNDLVQIVRAAHLGQVQLHPDITRKPMSAIATEEADASRPGILPSS